MNGFWLRFQEFFQREALAIGIDFVDILLVAFLIYRVLALLKGTRAMQTALGLSLVFLVYYVARKLHLVTLWTILDELLTSLVLVVVVLFQSDLRRALMRVGQHSFFSRGKGSQGQPALDAVVRAAATLMQKRLGALIVFERNASLDQFLEPGVVLDAAVSRELLYSVFIPSFENPMHDGAVVLRDGRIWQAGVFLPLSTQPRLDRSLGTRHRAAIGISEETDAVAVVVSEERGSASLCFNGNIVRDLDASSLRIALSGFFSRRRKSRKGKAGAERVSGELSN